MSVALPDVTPRVLRVWGRNARVWARVWKVNFLPPLLEPLLYVASFGLGLSGLVGEVSHRGAAVPYLSFIAPALVAVATMNNSFFETTYASFVRMHYQRTFEAMLATPLSVDEVITGEILWAGSRALLSAAVMLAVLAPFGLFAWPGAVLLLPLSLLGGLAFASAGMVFTGILPGIESFNLPTFLFITPMFLLSGTFFPLESLPPWLAGAARLLPLTHLTELMRLAALGIPSPAAGASLLYLVLFAAAAYGLALAAMRRRLVS
jgi:lipooligosaccharide transport system permease protein